MQGDTLFLALIRQLLQDITSERRCVYNIVIRILRMEHRETVMMARGQTNILGAGGLDGRHPFAGIKPGRIKARREFGVLLPVDVGIVHIPFALRRHTVNTPMEENAEFVILKSLTGLLVLG